MTQDGSVQHKQNTTIRIRTRFSWRSTISALWDISSWRRICPAANLRVQFPVDPRVGEENDGRSRHNGGVGEDESESVEADGEVREGNGNTEEPHRERDECDFAHGQRARPERVDGQKTFQRQSGQAEKRRRTRDEVADMQRPLDARYRHKTHGFLHVIDDEERLCNEADDDVRNG